MVGYCACPFSSVKKIVANSINYVKASPQSFARVVARRSKGALDPLSFNFATLRKSEFLEATIRLATGSVAIEKEGK